ncbi:MAG: hypothetical protein K8T89_14245 [Planctomycetes bacterium]|nr:hypothetical protein [Planctomycetota bacterium]
MKQFALIAVGLFVSMGVAAAEQKPGTIRGTVKFVGIVPPDRKIATSDGGSVIHNDLIVHPKSKGLLWTFVVVEDAPTQPKLKDAEPPEIIDQKDMLFIPRMVAVQHGRQVRFDNSDICNHSVRTFAATPSNEMNVFVTAAQPLKKIFAPEKHPIQVGCTLHGWMSAWVFVVPHPWFAITDEKGEFTIKQVPPGKHTLWFRHPDTRLQERRDIEVKSGEVAEVAIEWKEIKKPPTPK